MPSLQQSILTTLLCEPLCAQTLLISPTSSLRNGGFEDANGTNYASVPFWESYFPEGDTTDPVLTTFPKSGNLRSFTNGFQGLGNRTHPSQTIPSSEWIVQEGDVFVAEVSVRAGANFDPGDDRVQMILHVVDAGGNSVADPASPTGFSDRLLSDLRDVPAADTYYDHRFSSLPVASGSPWIGKQVRLRVLHSGDRDEYLIIDDIQLTGYRADELTEEAALLAHYPGNGDASDIGPSSLDGTPDPQLAFASGFGNGASFETTVGSLTLPVTLPPAFSIALWMKAPSPGMEGNELSWREGAALIDGSIDSSTGWGLTLRDHQISFGVGTTTITSQTFVADNEWHHIVATRSGITGELQLFVDGELEDVKTTEDAWQASSDLEVGASRLGGRRFNGSIDDLQIHSGVLGVDDLNAIRIGEGDIDGDGFTNEEEADVGTRWGEASDFPTIREITHENNEVKVVVDGKRSRTYQLERQGTPAPAPPEAIPDQRAPLESDAPVELTDPAPPVDKAFYRVRSEKGDLPRPNILLIVGDDHGYADISAFPNARPDITTPNFDRLATSGTILTQAYVSSPVCSPSRCGFLTGRYQNEWDAAGGWTPRLPGSVKHLAEYLRDAGYATAMIGKNDFGQPVGSTNNREHPPNHGFDRFFGFNAHAHDFWLHSQTITDSVQPAWPTEASAHLGKLVNTQLPGGFETFPDGTWQTELFTDRAIGYLEERKNESQPFFLYLSHASVHALIHQAPKIYLDAEGVPELPLYDPATDTQQNPASYTTYYYRYSRPFPQDSNGVISDGDMRKYYRAHLRAFDDQMGRLLDALEAKGLSDDTIVIYFSDNGGEALTGANNQPLSGSKYTTFEGGLRIPMMISWPGRVPGGQVYTHVASALDIVPTLLDVAGVEHSAPLRGHSLIAPLKGNTPVVPGQRTLFWRFNDQWAIRHGDWKLVLGSKGIAAKHTSQIVFNEDALNQVALFNLSTDPGEDINLADSTDPAIQAIRADLQARYDAWQASF